MKDIEEVEKVQKRATKQVKSLHGLPYEQRFRKLNLPTLRYRRHCGDMIEVYKILHGIYDKDISDGILHMAQDSRTRGHSLKLVAQHSKIEIRRNCFAVRVVAPWNSLPEFVVSSKHRSINRRMMGKPEDEVVLSLCYDTRNANVVYYMAFNNKFSLPTVLTAPLMEGWLGWVHTSDWLLVDTWKKITCVQKLQKN